MKLPWKYTWLVIFIDDGMDDEQAFLNHVERLQEILQKAPNFTTLKLNGEELKQIGTTVTADMEITEAFSKAILNEIISKRKESKVNRLAVVFRRGHFSNEEAFITAIRDTYFDNSRYYAICARNDFLSLTKKLECYEASCRSCKKLSDGNDGCRHSCLARLLWLLFDMDDRVIEELECMSKN